MSQYQFNLSKYTMAGSCLRVRANFFQAGDEIPYERVLIKFTYYGITTMYCYKKICLSC